MRRALFKSSASHSAGLSTAALAPMVDMLTILLVAVLRTWSSQPPVEVPEPGFELPVSREERAAPRGVTVDVGADGLYVQGWRAGSSTFWSESEDVLIPEMRDALQAMGGQTVVIRADRTAPWALVGKVLFTAQQAGYNDIQLIAASRASL